MNVSVGSPVIPFALEDEKGKLVSNEDLLGKKYILFFYPKDDSPGCTKEACSVRDNYKAIKKSGYEIYGVSPDKAKKHQKFIDKYEFQYSLLADVDKKMILDFGLWGPKKFMGREITGVYRTTVIVDEAGIVSHIIDKVKTKMHGEQILELIQNEHSAIN